MAKLETIIRQRLLWTALMGLAALAFWVVAVGVGLREWLLVGDGPGIVAHTNYTGLAAAPWMIVAAILTLTTVVMAVGFAIVRHMVEGTRLPVVASEDDEGPIAELPRASDEDADGDPGRDGDADRKAGSAKARSGSTS